MISVHAIKYAYDKNLVLENISFDFLKGRITTVLGPNGCGKSTLLNLIAKLLDLQHGQVYIDFAALQDLSRKELALSIVFQHNVSPNDITVRELVSYGRNPHKAYFARLSEEDKKIIYKALEQTNLLQFADRSISTLSGGERQRVWIAVALAQQPSILLLDEPTTYLDIHHQFEILNLVRKINRENGITVVMVLHDINMAAKYSDYLLFLKDGRIFAHGRPEDVLSEDLLRKVYQVDSTIIRMGEQLHVILKNLYREECEDEDVVNLLKLNR